MNETALSASSAVHTYLLQLEVRNPTMHCSSKFQRRFNSWLPRTKNQMLRSHQARASHRPRVNPDDSEVLSRTSWRLNFWAYTDPSRGSFAVFHCMTVLLVLLMREKSHATRSWGANRYIAPTTTTDSSKTSTKILICEYTKENSEISWNAFGPNRVSKSTQRNPHDTQTFKNWCQVLLFIFTGGPSHPYRTGCQESALCAAKVVPGNQIPISPSRSWWAP